MEGLDRGRCEARQGKWVTAPRRSWNITWSLESSWERLPGQRRGQRGLCLGFAMCRLTCTGWALRQPGLRLTTAV